MSIRSLLITGASTGIGEACSLELDRLGFRVFAGVRRDEDAQRLRERASASLVPVILDVTDPDSIAAGAETIRAAVGAEGLFGLVNNAGIAVAGPLELLPIDEIRRQFEVNVFGQLAVTQAMLPLVRAARGRIVMMSSVSGRIAAPYLGPYAASKFALEALSDSLRVELRRWGIAISLVEPGSVKTPIWQKTEAKAQQVLPQIPAEKADLYTSDIDAVRAATAKIAARAMPVERVVRAVVHALTARRPKPRYPVGFDTQVWIELVKFLPTGVKDWLIRHGMGLA